MTDVVADAAGPSDSLGQLERWCIEITRPIAFLGVIGMLAVSGVTMLDVGLRWLANSGVTALNEIVSMTFAVTVTATIPSGLAQRVNLKLDLLEAHYDERWKAWMSAAGEFLLLLFFAILAYGLYKSGAALAAQGRVTTILHWPRAPFIYGAAALILVGVAVQIVVAAGTLRRALANSRMDVAQSWSKAKIYAAVVAGVLIALIAFGAVAWPVFAKFVQANPVLAVVASLVLLWCVLLTLVPVAAAMGLIGLIGSATYIGFDPALSVFATEATGFLTNINVAVLPLFLMMGSFAAAAGVADDAYALAHAILSRFKGGLAMATIGGCAGFGAVTGSSVATAATIGRVALPEMKARGYDPALSTGCVAAGGTLGNFVPPGSGPLVLFALLTEASIGQLFIASVFPAALVIAAYLATVFLYVRLVPSAAPAPAPRKPGELRGALRRCGPLTVLFLGVLGGMYGGVFTATEAAAIGAFGAFLVALFRRKLRRAVFWQVMAETTAVTAMIYTLVFGALVFAFFTEVTGLAEASTKFIADLGWPPLALIALLLVIFIVLGTFMEAYTIMIITIPIVTPLVLGAGYDLVWWGVINLFVVEIGAISPPFGLTMFILKSFEDVPMSVIFKGAAWFCIAAILALAVLVLFPPIALWLPSTMYN